MKNLEDPVRPESTRASPRPARPERAVAPALSKLLGLRRVAGKVARRAKKLVGKPDNSPWILRPGRRAPQNTYVDFIFGLDYLSPNSRLVELFHEAMSPYGVSVLLVNQTNVDRVIADIELGCVQPHVY